MTKTLEQRIARIEQILKDNDQHEIHCPAKTNPASQAFFGYNIGKDQCDCWISLDNPEPDPTKGFVIYEKATEQLQQTLFRSRYDAVEFLTHQGDFSRDSKADNHWGKTFFVLPGTANPTTESSPTE